MKVSALANCAYSPGWVVYDNQGTEVSQENWRSSRYFAGRLLG